MENSALADQYKEFKWKFFTGIVAFFGSFVMLSIAAFIGLQGTISSLIVRAMTVFFSLAALASVVWECVVIGKYASRFAGKNSWSPIGLLGIGLMAQIFGLALLGVAFYLVRARYQQMAKTYA